MTHLKMPFRIPEHMNIALIGPAYPYRGGIAHFTEMLYGGLRTRGHAVEAITFTRQYPDVFFPGKTQYATVGAEDRMPAERLIDSINPLSWLLSAHQVAGRRPDAVVFQHWMPFFGPAFGSIARYLRWKGIPSLAVVHNALPHERRPGDVLLTKFFLRACRGLVVLSEAVEENVRHLAPGARIRRVAHPVYDRFGAPPPKAEARKALDLPDAAPVLLFFGFVRRYKGLHTLLEALPRVAERLPNAQLVVAGEFYDDEAPSRALIRQHQLGGRVHLHSHYIPDDEVPRYFAAADAVVQPYVSATQSGVAQVAFHFGTPLVTTDVGGLAEVVGDAGLVVPPDDPTSLAMALTRLFTEEALYERVTEGARREGQAASPDRLCKALEELVVLSKR